MIAELKNQNYLARPKPFLMASKRSEYLKQILDDPHFTKTAFALDLYPNKSGKDAAAEFTPKLHGAKYRSLKEAEEDRIEAELHRLADLINTLLPRKIQAQADQPHRNDARKSDQPDTDWAKQLLGHTRKEGS